MFLTYLLIDVGVSKSLLEKFGSKNRVNCKLFGHQQQRLRTRNQFYLTYIFFLMTLYNRSDEFGFMENYMEELN